MEYFKYNNKKIEYKIIRKKVKNINLRIKPNLEISVSANKNVPKKVIVDFINSKRKWIYNKIKALEEKGINKLEFKNGDKIYFLGKKYDLVLFKSSKNAMYFKNKKLFMTTTNLDDYLLKEKIYYSWLKYNGKIIFNRVLEDILILVKELGIKPPKMTIRRMKTRWGSCSVNKNKININAYLVGADKGIIEYIILHELIHFIHPNHSKDFYDLVKSIMPDYKLREKRLKDLSLINH